MTDNVNLKLYLTPEQYKVYAGGDWPTYEEFVAGARPSNPDAQQYVDAMLNYTVKEQGKMFPIRTKTSCQSKWAWSTIYLNSLTTSSCHRVHHAPINLDNFDNFHNLPNKLNDRRLMLNGEWPTAGCQYCKDIEDAGGHSDRLHNLAIPDLTPPELETDPTAIVVTPTIVEIFAQNTCNFSCIYCNDSLSSKIQQENIKFGDFDKAGVKIPITNLNTTSDDVFQKFLNWLEKNIRVLKRLHLLGGETFLQEQLMDSVLAIIENNPNPDLQLCVFSNMKVPDKLWDRYINRIKDLQNKKHIKVFDLTASIDCWGPEAEYTRYGLNLDKFEDRFAWASQEGDWIRLNANQTVTATTMRSMVGLIDKIRQYSKNKHIGHYFQFYTGMQMFQHPQTFSYKMWESDFEKIFEAMPKNTPSQLEAIPRMEGLQKQLQLVNQHNFDDIKKLHIYLDEIDRRRNTNWRNVFPYLDIHE
jgi:hypothetical protein